MRTTITISADRYLQELVAFYEIAGEPSYDNTQIMTDWFTTHAKSITADEFSELSEVLRQTGDALSKAARYLEDKENGQASDAFVPINIDTSGRQISAIFSNFLLDMRHRALLDRNELTSRAFLITAISSFEVLFGHLVRSIHQRNPNALSKSEHAFTLEELSQYTSIDEARDSLVTRRIETLLMESVDSWAKWLTRTVNIELSTIIDDWLLTREYLPGETSSCMQMVK